MHIRFYHGTISLLAIIGLTLWLINVTYSPWPTAALLLVCATLLLYRPSAWLILIPTLWPFIDLVPSTGRMYFTESDALALLCIAVLSIHSLKAPPAAKKIPNPLVLIALMGGILLSYVISSIYALTPLPAMDDNAFVGYASPFNALRLSKGILWALLLLPHWLRLNREMGPGAQSLLRIGMTGGLVSVSLAALWDRLAFNALLDFASDYRTTALFWEMHVGGAALDGWLMLTFPFAVAGLLQAHQPRSIALHAFALSLGIYAILTTFSRGVYLGCAVMLLCILPFWLRHHRNQQASRTSHPQKSTGWVGPILFILLALSAILVFQGGGYRGLGAMFAASIVIYLAGAQSRPQPFHKSLPVLGSAALLTACSYLLHAVFPQAAYILFGLSLLCAVFSSHLVWRKTSASRTPLAVAALWCAMGTSWVCWHWGGDDALLGGLLASGLLVTAFIMQTTAKQAIWSLGREQTTAAIIAAVTALALAVGIGSYQIGLRFSTASEDMAGRIQHWRDSIALIQNDTELITGIGVGRYVDRNFWLTPSSEKPGLWNIGRDSIGTSSGNTNGYLHLIGPRFEMRFHQLLRVSQRIETGAQGPFKVKLRARSSEPVNLHLEVCQKHLLYPGECASPDDFVIPGGNKWVGIEQQLSEKPFENLGQWFAPKQLSFSIAIPTKGKGIDIDNLELFDAKGQALLKNGDFSKGADHWFFSSDRIHLPYHAKSLAIHLLVEQGIIGLIVVALAALTAIARLGFGLAKSNPVSPAMLAALGGFLTVGLFDSLIDVPRLAFFFYLLLGMTISLRAVSTIKNSENATPTPKLTNFKFRINKKIWIYLGLSLIPLVILSVVVFWSAVQFLGYTPGELLDYSERTLKNKPIEPAISPVISITRNLLDEPSLADRRKLRFEIPNPPELVRISDETTTQSQAKETTSRILKVGPRESIRSIAEAAKLAQDGDIVEIAAGEYRGDVAVWHQRQLTIRGVGGNARLFANGKAAEGKAIWVIRNGKFDISNIDFIGARVSDRNGAGIRFENGHLFVKNCLFWGGENGILTASGENHRKARLDIENSEFGYNGNGDGLSHNIYVGSIDTLRVTGSYFHHANVGHLLKSRAAHNEILYNRITDETGGQASYELDLPNGGVALVIGNILQQGRNTENSTLISYGREGYIWPRNELYLASNTLVNDHPSGGTFLRTAPGARVISTNNLMIGKGRLHSDTPIEAFNDTFANWDVFLQPSRYDYRLNSAGQLIVFTPFSTVQTSGTNLNPQREYAHPRVTLELQEPPHFAGAIQTISNQD